MAGAFQYAKTKGGAYESLANVALVVGLLAQVTFMAAALYFVEDVRQKKPEVIEAIADDEEVKTLDVKIEAKAQARKGEIVWVKVPMWLRFLMITASVIGVTTTWYVVLFGSECFSDFDITMDPDAVLCMSGTPENPAGWAGICETPIVKPIGWGMIGCFGYVVFVLMVWRKWAARKTRQALKRIEKAAAAESAEAI